MYGIPKRKHAANGGLIEGPGTGTSDSINKDVPGGTYILPADTTAQLGLGMPGRNGQSAPAQEQPGLGMPGKQVPVAVSNGEYEVPPQDVHALGAVVLDQLKNATHQQKGFGLTKAVMAADKGKQGSGPRQYFADGGLVDDEERRGFGVRLPTSTLAQPELPRLGLPARQSSGQPASTGSRALDVPLGAVQAVAGAVRTPIAAGQDAIRNAAAYIAGGDPETLPGGSARYRDEAVGQFQAGVDRVGGAFSGLGEAARDALGVQPRQEQQVEQPRLGIPRQQAEQGSAEQPRLGIPGRAGESWRQAGDGIAGRTGDGGVPEFTNDPSAVAGAEAGTGVAGVGNGRGALSVGQPGDSQLALERYQRANDIRADTIREARRGQIGEGGGRLTVVEDNSWLASRRAPTIAERQRARMAGANAQTDAIRSQTQQGEANAAVERATAAQRMGTEQLNQQRLQQQIAEGDLSVQDRQRLDQLRAQINDPTLSERERAQAMDAYNALSITPDARLKAQQEADTQQNRLIGDLYKSFSNLQTPPTIGEGESARPMSFEEWLQPALRAIQAGGQQGQSLPQGVSQDAAIAEARSAIASGASRDAVNARLAQWGIGPV